MHPRWFTPALADALQGLSLPARRAIAGRGDGRHPSRLPGTGLEFAQFRGYQPGDDPRRVDWKLLARSDRFFVREADAETALPLRVLVDASRSMAHTEDGVAKFDIARLVAASLALVAIRQGDTPSVALLPGDMVPASRDARQLDRVLHLLDRAAPTGELPARIDVAFGGGHARDGLLLVITDGHDPERHLLRAVERSGLDATFLVLRTAREGDLDYGEPVVLEDLESGAMLTIEAGAHHRRAEADAAYREAAKHAGIDWVALDPAAPLAPPLRQWLAARAGRA